MIVSLALFGLVFGSFANVVIWRFPRGESLSSPGSHCPVCETAIRWYDNIPVVSWILLRARCRRCGSRISARYPSVELLSGLLWVFAGILFGASWRTLFAAFFFYMLMILTFIDLDTMRLPNRLVGITGAVGLAGVAYSQVVGAPLMPLLDGPSGSVAGMPAVWAVLGFLSASGVALLIAAVYARVRHTAGFGMGDVKLLAVIGVFLGPYALLTLFLGSAAGAVYGIAVARAPGGSLRSKFPFGPFLAGAALLVTALGPTLWYWYLGLLGIGKL